MSIKLLRGFKKQCDTFFFSTGLGAYPMLAKLFLSVGDQSLAWICNINCIVTLAMPLDLVNNDKVILIPMDDTR